MNGDKVNNLLGLKEPAAAHKYTKSDLLNMYTLSDISDRVEATQKANPQSEVPTGQGIGGRVGPHYRPQPQGWYRSTGEPGTHPGEVEALHPAQSCHSNRSVNN